MAAVPAYVVVTAGRRDAGASRCGAWVGKP